ncbi:MAG: hypothetical protein M1817_005080 [Caeruleum heppii]|nr:MAG: hypothetical protein M1817_005080 [Caeruleum heppii]
MFRTSCLSLARRRAPHYARYHVMRSDGPYKLQRVRFQRPFITRQGLTRLMVFTGLISGAVEAATWKIIGDEDEEDEAEQNWPEDHHAQSGQDAVASGAEDENVSEADDEAQSKQQTGEKDDTVHGDEVDENATFVPLGWVRQRPRQPYKGTDPEWQEFMKFSEDRDRNMRTRHDLAGMVGETMRRHRFYSSQMGSPMEVRKYWLDVDYPVGPPPEYERSGLEISDEYISWTTRSVHPRSYERLQRFLQPGPILSSLYTTVTIMFHHNLQELKTRLGIESKPNAGAGRSSGPYTPIPSTELDRLRQNKRETGSTGTKAPTALPPPPGKPHLPQRRSPSTSNPTDPIGPPPSPQSPGHLAMAYMAFRTSMARAWSRQPSDPPRGTIVVSGLVEVVSPKAMAVIDVVAAFDPKSSRWEQVNMRTRRFQWRNQTPRG